MSSLVRKIQRAMARRENPKAARNPKRHGNRLAQVHRPEPEKLYVKLPTKDGSNWYMPKFCGKHNIKCYSRANEAQARAEAVRDRYRRLQAAARRLKEQQASPRLVLSEANP